MHWRHVVPALEHPGPVRGAAKQAVPFEAVGEFRLQQGGAEIRAGQYRTGAHAGQGALAQAAAHRRQKTRRLARQGRQDQTLAVFQTAYRFVGRAQPPFIFCSPIVLFNHISPSSEIGFWRAVPVGASVGEGFVAMGGQYRVCCLGIRPDLGAQTGPNAARLLTCER